MSMWTCECGSLNRGAATACEYCDRARGATSRSVKGGESSSVYVCQDCRQPATIKAGALVVDGQYLCGDCHWQRLRRAASRPEDPCGVEGCSVSIREHMSAFHQHMAAITDRMTGGA